MDHDRPTPLTDQTVVRMVLPEAGDLWGEGWERTGIDADGDDAEPLRVGTESCVPEDYPDGAAVADAEVTFERPGALVHAVATVFADVPSAVRAWTIVGGESFARCFAESMVAEVDLPPDAHLLGPVSEPAALALDRRGQRCATHRSTWARAGDEGLLPIALDLAVVLSGRALVVVWAVDEDRRRAEDGWPRLVDRLERRGAAALAL